jgi:hypothetical protein
VSARFEADVRETGITCRVEIRDRLAILVPDGNHVRLSAEDRQRILQRARAEGFTHVALEIDPDGAAVPGD